jgi:L-histidine Nalpha-methyltransferase
MTPDGGSPFFTPYKAARAEAFLDDVLEGLGQTPKQLSPKYFYDTRGSQLFDAICELPEYYVTRTELAILETHAVSIANALGGPIRLVEPGAGSGTKTRVLLRALGPERCVEYVPVDIAGEHLAAAANDLRRDLPWLVVTPIAADFVVDLPIASSDTADHTAIYFPGSTIGNFDPCDAAHLLARFRRAAGRSGGIVLGVDLKKDPAVLHAAYNDAQGVTAAFNKNALRRMNAELGADFDEDTFDHYAFYDPVNGRIEMHLVSRIAQTVTIGGRARFTFREGESICTERSYKYDLGGVERLAHAAGLTLEDAWLDDERRFAVLRLRAPA